MKITPLLKSSINYLKLLSEKHNYNHPNFYNRKFDEAHQKINITELDINENKIINQVHLQNLCNRYSFINNVLELRFETNDLNIYRNSTIEIIKSYLENLYIDNVDYGDDIFKTKDYSRANNIISARRKEIINDLDDILYYVEIHFKSISNSEEEIVTTDLNVNNSSKKLQDLTPRIKIKPGPTKIGLKYYAFKYVLIQKFYPDERICTEKYSSQLDFLKKIAIIENIVAISLKKPFNNINLEPNIERACQENLEIINLLNQHNAFSDYKLAKDFIDKILNK